MLSCNVTNLVINLHVPFACAVQNFLRISVKFTERSDNSLFSSSPLILYTIELPFSWRRYSESLKMALRSLISGLSRIFRDVVLSDICKNWDALLHTTSNTLPCFFFNNTFRCEHFLALYFLLKQKVTSLVAGINIS